MVSKNFWIHHCIIIYIWSLRIVTFCDIPYLPAATKLWPREYFYTCLSFCSQGGGVCLSACWDTTTTTPGTRPPRSRHPPGTRHPPKPDPPEQTPHTPGSRHPPRADTTPPWEADSSIRSTSGRYASYWNAFLFVIKLSFIKYNFNLGYLKE